MATHPEIERGLHASVKVYDFAKTALATNQETVTISREQLTELRKAGLAMNRSLTRFDKEAFAIEKMAEQVQNFKQSVQVLFHHGACLRTGFTKLCLDHLRMQKAVRDGSGRVRMIGGPAFDLDALSKHCL